MSDDAMDSSVVEPMREQNFLVRVGMEAWTQSFTVPHNVRLVNILKNLHTSEVKIYSYASKEFIELLNGESGGEALQEYVQQSPQLVELLEAWRLHREKPGMGYILSLFATVLGHPDGKLRRHGSVKRTLDGVARMILEDKEKMGDVYLELNSGKSGRQNAALDLLAAIVRRGGGLASEVAERFDFKMAILPQLAGTMKKKGSRDGGNRRKGAESGSTRRSFIGFAMSFLEVGNPRLLRWVLQQKEVYSGVLRGIANDDAETVMYVLSTLRDNVLIEESLLPPGLRSVLFGSATLEQLSLISGNLNAGEPADIAHEVLVMVCTDPKNGLMPGSNLRGNEKRLLDLMKKLKATEVDHHKNLLLAIVSKRLSLCSAYMNEFPYNIEPRQSPSWFAAISLAADIIASAKCDSIVHTLSSNSRGLVSTDDDEVQVVLKCIVPNVCSRAMINRGLLHSDDLVKHGSLRLVFESVNLLCYIIEAINGMVSRGRGKSEFIGSAKVSIKVDDFRVLSCSDASLVDKVRQVDETQAKRWISLREYIQDEVHGAMPDPQVLLKLLSSAGQKYQNYSQDIQKKNAQLSEPPQKKRRCNSSIEFDDIIIGGIDVEQDKGTSEEHDLDFEDDRATTLCEIWGLDKQDPETKDAKVAEDVFRSKLLDVLRLYLRVMPSSFEGSYDFFRIIPPNPLDLSKDEQQSLLSLLLEYSGQSGGCWNPERVPESMYKYLQPLFYIMLHSEIKNIRDQAYILVKAAMASSGAFDQNFTEIDAWFIFLPGYEAKWCMRENLRVGAPNKLSHIVIPFLCDAISVVGNNLYKYQEHTRKLISKSDQFEGCSLDFSPLVICVLQKCLRLLDSVSGSMKLHEKSTISLYVCNTIHLILQSQVHIHLLPDLIGAVLNERFDKFSSEEMISRVYFAEWRPLTNMLHFLRRISDRQNICLFTTTGHSSEFDGKSLCSVSRKVEEMLNQDQTNSPDDVAAAFLFSIVCAPPEDVMGGFPDLLHVVKKCFPSHLAFLSSVLFLQHDYLTKVASCWPDTFFSSIRRLKDVVDADHVNTVEDGWKNLSVSSESTPLSAFLSASPFCALLPSVLNFAFSAPDEIREAHKDPLLRLLEVKLSECTFSEVTLYLRVILFWSHHLLLPYTIKRSNIIEQPCHLCIALVDRVFERIQVLISHTSSQSKSPDASYPVQRIQDIVDSVIQHPIVALSLSCSLSNHQNLADGSLEHLEDALAAFSKENLHLLDRFVLNLLCKLYDLLLMFGSFEANYSRDDGPSHKSLLAAPNLLLENIILLFKEKFELCMDKVKFGMLLPNFYMVHTLSKFLSPVKLLDLANWMFSKLGGSSSSCSPAFVPAVFMCLYINDIAMEMLCFDLQKTDQISESNLLWDLDIHNADITTIQQAYHIVLHVATRWNLEFADHCLLKMLSRIHHTERYAGWKSDYIALHMILSTMAINTPIDIVHHCIFSTSKVKAKALLLLLEASPVHMDLFCQIFLEIFKKEETSALQVKDSDSNASWTQEDGAILLLPAALSCLKCHGIDNRQCAEFLEPVPIFYSELLLCEKGFSSWKRFVTRTIFEEEFRDLPTSVEDMVIYFSGTLLGKSVTMLRYYFALKEMSWKQRLEIVASIFPESSELLDSDVNDINPSSCNSIMKLTNELFAKISLIRLLLSPRKLLSNEVSLERESKRVHKAKLNFISILVRTIDKIFMSFPSIDYTSSHSAKEKKVICFLEFVILKNIIELSSEIQSHLNQLKSIPFLNQFIRSSLLHRFNDPVAIKAIRCILVVLSQGKFAADEILELILGHSNFVSTITCSEVSEYPSTCNTTGGGGMLQPAPSILKLVDSFVEENKPQISIAEKRRVEIIRLLRVLYDIKSRQQNNNRLSESRELVFLLLSVYGATLSDTDLEILHLMNEIESPECRTITEVDHLWGTAALKFREELKLDFSKSDKHNTENEEITERRRTLFRENMPIDSKLCANTSLLYCYKRSSRASAFSLEQLQHDNFADSFEVISQRMDVLIYDPIFILRFSIHTLLMGYIEPAEFARLGLLAITLVSIASPDRELRILGYECLGAFKHSLEASQRSKETWQLQLLLTYIQNGISEQWQRIPSIISVFAAEASLTLLDSSHARFTAISNFLMHSTSVSLQNIPLFPSLLQSGSVHFKAERLWMLRLLSAGLNLADDAKIYKRGRVLELVLAFCSSPVSDSESKVLVLKVLKKCVKLPVLASHLVKESGLLLWLSSLISTCSEGSEGSASSCSRVTELTLEVVNDLISSRLITDWLQETALQHLSALSSDLCVLLINNANLLKGNVPMLTSVLSVITSTMRLSMKRKIYQPHFTLSLHGVFNLCLAISVSSRSTEHKLAELGINAILMNGPVTILSEMDKSRTSTIMSWAISNIFWLYSNQRSPLEIPCLEPLRNESLLAKILRLLVASVILGRISSLSHGKSGDLARSTGSLGTLRSFLNDAHGRVETAESCSANDTLAIIILYLQDHVPKNSDSLPSVVMAICLLLLDRSNKQVNKHLADNCGKIEMLCSKIRCPAESNPAWRWHYYQPWKDSALQRTEMERMEEEQACRSLLILFSNAFSACSSEFPVLSLDDVEKCGLFQWERDSMTKQSLHLAC